MKVLVIPSWYPYPDRPIAGKFFYDQAKALAENDSAEVAILNWGQNEYQLQIRHPLLSMVKLLKFYNAKTGCKKVARNFTELLIPHLSFTSRVLNGNIDALVNKLNLPEKPDLIHAHVTFPAGYLAWKLSQKLSVPFIITEHSGPFPFPEFVDSKGISPLITLPLQAANKVLAVSSFLQQALREKVSLEADIVPNLVDTDYFKPSYTPIPSKRFRLFALSSLTEAKGALDLIQAVKICRDAQLDFCLYWGGDGYLKAKLHKFVQQQGLQTNVVFLGQIDSNQALYQYQNCDCFVMPSHIESFSVVLIEALACGKPVVATDCGGPKDIVNELCGILVKTGAPTRLAGALMHMAVHKEAYSGSSIRKYCIENYSYKVVSKQIQLAYLSVLNNN